MTDATTAARAIQNMSYPPGTAGHAMAGIVLAQLNEAITHLEAALESARSAEAWFTEEGIDAALACLRNEPEAPR